MSSCEEFPLNSSVIHGVKREPLETDLSTDDLRENNSSFLIKNSTPQFSPDGITASTSYSLAYPSHEVTSKQRNKIRHRFKKPYICQICGMSFLKQGLFLNHRANVHNDYPTKCLECGEPMKKNNLLVTHMKKFHPTKLISCDMCLDKFLTNNDLKQHYNTLHQGKKCSECGEIVKKNKLLKIHMRKFHPTKLISCDVCSDGFLKYKDLKEHYKKHQGKSTRSWNISNLENSASGSVESKECMKTEFCTDVSTGTEESKDNLGLLSLIKAEPI